MLENPNDSTIATTTVKRYAHPNQRNRVLNRRKSGDRFGGTNSAYGNDGDKNQAASRNIPIIDHGEAGSSNLLNDKPHPGLIAINGCCNSEAAQLLNYRWAAAMHSFNDPPLDLSERPVMYSGAGGSAWGHSRAPPQVDFLAELRRAMRDANASVDAKGTGTDSPTSDEVPSRIIIQWITTAAVLLKLLYTHIIAKWAMLREDKENWHKDDPSSLLFHYSCLAISKEGERNHPRNPTSLRHFNCFMFHVEGIGVTRIT
ncbi:hypothetical protein BVC80_8399g9 [Macleaya cordata]|uniref:Uncharacterized protein n=1 Tax=Macleaya cordata TaxID=56857 RepID=A0A200Q7E3_MACCD|nr:hypothetical protein BVC80_8399g9 [Macleaya cordata]